MFNWYRPIRVIAAAIIFIAGFIWSFVTKDIVQVTIATALAWRLCRRQDGEETILEMVIAGATTAKKRD